MVVLCGIDLVEDSRIEKNMNNSLFMKRIYSVREITFDSVKKLASIFALKESVFKALDITSSHWLDIEVNYLDSGKPIITLSKNIIPEDFVSLDCSVTHEKGMTQAMVVISLKEKK